MDDQHLTHNPEAPASEPGETESCIFRETPPAEPGVVEHSLVRGLARNLGSGVKLALFRLVSPAAFAHAPADLALLATADLGLNLVLSFLLVGAAGSFGTSAVTAFFFHLPLMLLCGLLAGRLLRRPGLITLLPTALISLSIPLELIHGVLEGMANLPRLQWLGDWLEATHYYRFFGWWLAGAALFLLRLAPARLPRRFAALGLFALIVALPLWYFPRGDLWVGEGTRGGEELHLTEEVLDAQPRLMDEQLARLLPGQPRIPHLYFVGFAGDGSQDVFMREVTSVARLFAQRFGTTGRTVTLVNSPQTATTQPFATATNLARALGRIGRVMNRDEDVLFLYLTSHGSPDHELAVDNGALELDEITPETLRHMLEKSGIKWKVIVVSACYAGGFIPPLQDDHTLIVTAADATHESFGCENGKDFTWFGKAYCDEALRTTYSFVTAFERARETIGKREKEEGETPSNPQIWVGEAIRRHLPVLEKQLAAGSAQARAAR